MHKTIVKTLPLILVMFLLSSCISNENVLIPDKPFWADDFKSASERFECAKKSSTPELITFLRKMPKGGDLHNHLSGATYSDYLLESARANQMDYDLVKNIFVKKDTVAVKHIITIDSLIKNSRYLYQFLDLYSMRGWYKNTNSGHDHFFDTFNYMSSAGRSTAEKLVEIYNRNRYQNVQYLELMTSCYVTTAELDQKLDAVLKNFDDAEIDRQYLQEIYTQLEPLLTSAALKKDIAEYLDNRDDNVGTMLKTDNIITGDDGDLVVRYISQLYRTSDLSSFFTRAVCSMAAINLDKRVVALNIVAAEDHPDSRVNFETQMVILDFLWEKMGQPDITLHAGELVFKYSPLEPMQHRISESITKGHARRIGHGVSLAWEHNVPGLLKMMKEKDISVEICLSSNESILEVVDKDHPFLLYKKAGVPLTLNTDDEGVSRGNLTMEYVKAVDRYDLSYAYVKTLVRNSLEYSFLPGESLYKDRDYTQIRDEFVHVRSKDWKAGVKAEKIMTEHSKLKRQVILERAFVEFEEDLASGFGL